MMGSVRDEASLFIIPQTKQFPAQFTEHEFDTLMATYNITGPQLAELKAIYGPGGGGGGGGGGYVYPKDLGNYSKWWWATVRTETDAVPGLGACGVRWLARSMLTGGTPVVYG